MKNYSLKGDLSIILRFKNYHYVLEGFKHNRNLCYRTQGLKELCGLELEFNLSLEPTEAKRILDCILNAILSGVKLEDNLVTSELTNAPILVKKMQPKDKYEENEEVYRIVFSDENFLLPEDANCSYPYKNQLN